MKIVSFKNVKRNFYSKIGETEVFKNLTFDIEEQSIVALLGPSGAGKSTILNLISGLIEPSEGTIIKPDNIGYMFQTDNLFEWRTIYRNITIGLEIKHLLTPEAITYINHLLKKYGLEDFKNYYPSELSGGMRQRVALIRTLALKPKLLLLDEPFSALDYQTRLLLQDDVNDIIKKEKITTIIVTHDISEAIAFSDEIIVLSSRPCVIKSVHKLTMDYKDMPHTPLNSRKTKEFKIYFDKIFKELENAVKD